jgi:transcription elongation GreA/GreB family factor
MELKRLVEFVQAQDLKRRNSNKVSRIWEEQDEEEIIAVTAPTTAKPKITVQSLVTLKNAEGKIFKVRFSPNEKNVKKQEDGGTKIIYERSPLAMSLMGRTEGEMCQLGMLEVYYEILRIE